MPRGGARVGAGRPKNGQIKAKASIPEAGRTPASPVAGPRAPEVDQPVTVKSPLQYMLDVMNDSGADEKLRAQMAVAAAPYMHAKRGEGGKKDEVADKAKAASAGRFKAAAPPLKLVARR
jgi:phage terminase small subunit